MEIYNSRNSDFTKSTKIKNSGKSEHAKITRSTVYNNSDFFWFRVEVSQTDIAAKDAGYTAVDVYA